MTNDLVLVDSGTGARRIRAGEYLDAAAEEHALASAHAWIKRLRHLTVEGQPLRRRFTVRGDSLWWFAELYLHKQEVVLELFRTAAALGQVIERERPLEIRVVGRNRILRGLAPQVARARGIRSRGTGGFGSGRLHLLRLGVRARALMFAARASRLRPCSRTTDRPATQIAAFVHRAFWRSGATGRAESYIGQVLDTLERRAADAVTYVGVGPTSNFRARRWWHPLKRGADSLSPTPIKCLAPLAALRDSDAIWRERQGMRSALWDSAELRQHSIIDGCDCWPIIREELAGIALLQWPWSARAMDEAGAALDVLRPEIALTYAEAGGWGRALMLECRRRRIPSVGLQHGFIHRHWLNYLHEPDEMAADGEAPSDAGFPRPTLTLLFDEYARRHLEQSGRFPAASLVVTGSPRLDALVEEARSLTPEAIERTRLASGADPSRALVLLVTKHREVKHVLPALVDAIASLGDLQLAIKTHPAETPEVYDAVGRGRPGIRVLPAAAPLAPLLCACRAVVTRNSTVALDAAVLGVPALVIGLPSNLSPFVEDGVMAGAWSDAEIAPALARILYDEEFRLQLDRERSAYFSRFRIGADGRAADRAADAVLQLIGRAVAG